MDPFEGALLLLVICLAPAAGYGLFYLVLRLLCGLSRWDWDREDKRAKPR